MKTIFVCFLQVFSFIQGCDLSFGLIFYEVKSDILYKLYLLTNLIECNHDEEQSIIMYFMYDIETQIYLKVFK